MTMLTTIAITNALTAVPLALLAWVVGRCTRRPALTHALWIVVLMKLVTPPLFQFPVPVSLSPETQTASATIPVVPVPIVIGDIDQGVDPVQIPMAATEVVLTPLTMGTHETLSSERLRATQNPSRASAMGGGPVSFLNDYLMAPLFVLLLKFRQAGAGWGIWLLNVWLIGTAISFGIQIWMVIRFGRRVAAASVRDEALQCQADSLARSMSLKRCPEVRVVAATISPMLWSCGAKTRMLFPQELMSRLNAESRETLVIHELAHYGRGDHWVRCLEFLATGLFWWHPVVWWARHQIEEVEEECCDNWVVSHIQQNPRRYAEALLDTIDFLCGVPSTVPPMASGLGNASFLRRRLTNIMRGASTNKMSHRLRAFVCLLMAILLPFQPLLFGSISDGAAALSRARDISSLEGSDSNRATAQLLARRRDDLPSRVTEPAESTETDTPTPVTPNQPLASPKSRVLRGEQVWSNAVSPDGRFVIRATTGRRVLLRDLPSNRETDLSEYGISAVSFTPDGHQFVAVTNDGQVMRWDAVKSQLIGTIYTHADALRSVSVSPEGDSVVVGGRDGSVNVIDLKTGSFVAQLPRQDLPVNCVRFSPDATRVAVAVGEWNTNSRGQVRLIDLQTRATETIKCETAPGALTFVSNDELIIGQWNGRATLWNLIQHKAVGAANADKAVIAAVSFSPDNPQLREIAFVSLKNTEDLFGEIFSQ